MEAAAASLQKAVDLNPGSAGAHSILGIVLGYLDKDNEALTHHHVALELGARDPALPVFMGRMGMTCLQQGRVEDALKWSERSVQANANMWPPYAQLAWIYMELGRQDEAREIVAKLRRVNPDLRAVDVEQIASLWDPDRAAVRRRADYLRALGLPK
jgi:adenylate cyclase